MLKPMNPLTASIEAGQRIESAGTLDELARRVITQLCSLYRCDAALLVSVSPAGDALCWASSPSVLPEMSIPGLPARIDQGTLAERALKTGKSVSLTEPLLGANGSSKAATVIAVPLKKPGGFVGVVQLTGAKLGSAEPGALLMLESLADKYALAISNLPKPPAGGPALDELRLRSGNREANERLHLEQVYASTYRGVRELLGCDTFFIALSEPGAATGEFVYRIEQEVESSPEQFSLGDGMIAYVLHQRAPVVVADVMEETRFKIRRWGGSKQVRSLVCVPMDHASRTIGVLSAQRYAPNAYTEKDAKVLRAFADQAALTIHNASLFAESQRKVEQLAVLNQVARIVSSTIEISRLLELIYGEVRRILAADSYYVAVIDQEKQTLSIEVMVDEEERFERTVLPVGDDLASLVVRQRAPLRLGNVAEQAPRLGATPSRLGKPKSSVSWLGVPMATSEHLLGLLAVGSYRVDAFDESDQEILQSVATQAAIAIDNARHHAEVEWQAQHDSLTDALNHGYFLVRLREEVERAEKSQSLLSLIMLDIDHFKQYNDSFGHLSGDTILRGIVQVAARIVKNTDLVGRWGGEEFVLALPGCDKARARQVAERIRKMLSEVKLEGSQGRAVPVPTVSQGIATFPEDAQSPFALVDLADVCLYKAKARGRDQISVAGEGEERKEER